MLAAGFMGPASTEPVEGTWALELLDEGLGCGGAYVDRGSAKPPPGKMVAMSGEVTRWLGELRRGRNGALDELVPLLYDELQILARSHLRNESRGATLDTTGLVHEAYLRLSKQHNLTPADRSQFFGIAATTMRRVLVDYARSRKRDKRGGGVVPLSLDEARDLLSSQQAEELVALDDALDRLASINPRGARCVEMRYFVGLGLIEIGDALGVSSKTVQRDLTAAQAWLRKEVKADLGLT